MANQTLARKRRVPHCCSAVGQRAMPYEHISLLRKENDFLQPERSALRQDMFRKFSLTIFRLRSQEKAVSKIEFRNSMGTRIVDQRACVRMRILQSDPGRRK